MLNDLTMYYDSLCFYERLYVRRGDCFCWRTLHLASWCTSCPLRSRSPRSVSPLVVGESSALDRRHTMVSKKPVCMSSMNRNVTLEQ